MTYDPFITHEQSRSIINTHVQTHRRYKKGLKGVPIMKRHPKHSHPPTMPVETRSQARARRLREERIAQAQLTYQVAHQRQLADEAHQRVEIWRQAPTQRLRYETRLAQADAARQARITRQLQRQAEEGAQYVPSPTPSIATTLPTYGVAQNTDIIQGIVLPRYSPLPPPYQD